MRNFKSVIVAIMVLAAINTLPKHVHAQGSQWGGPGYTPFVPSFTPYGVRIGKTYPANTTFNTKDAQLEIMGGISDRHLRISRDLDQTITPAQPDKDFLLVREKWQETWTPRLIFTKDHKLGINTGTPEERLTVRDGSVFIDMEGTDPEDALGVLIKAQSRPLITAYDSRSWLEDRFISGPFKDAGTYGLLKSGGNLMLSIAHDPANYRYNKFTIVGSDKDGNMEEYLSINENGIVGINCADINLHWATGYKLHVKGGIRADKVRIDIDYNNWPDYVFDSSYRLRSLSEVKTYIDKNKHLPDVPSAREISENGADLAEINAALLRKIEELTLYAIDMEQRLEDLKDQK